MLLINCEINFILTWSNIFFIIGGSINGQEPTFTMTDAKFYVTVYQLYSLQSLSTQNNGKLLEQ